MKNEIILNIVSALNQIDINKVTIKTAFWMTKNMRNFEAVAKEFDELKKSITSTELFKKYSAELESAIDEDKAKVEGKYKELLDDANKELQEFLAKETSVKVYTIAQDLLEGIESKFIPVLFDLIKA